MAAWRTRAYEMFDFRPGAYSSARGKVELLADLFAMLRRAAKVGDDGAISRVLSYVEWAAAQKGADGLASAIDLAFFLPAFRDPDVCGLLKARLPEALLSEKWRVLVEKNVGQAVPDGTSIDVNYGAPSGTT